MWRWHPAAGDTTGRGALTQINIPDDATWGVGARAMGTYVTNALQNSYNFYIVLPSQQQVMKYTPATDGSGYPAAAKAGYFAVNQDVSSVTDMYIDGKVYLVDKGKVTQYYLGQAVHGWSVDPLPDTLIRPQAPFYKYVTADNPKLDEGTFYAYDNASRRIVAFKKSDGSIQGQYMVPSDTPWFSALNGLFVIPGSGGADPTLYWIESGSLMKATLTPSTPSTPTATAAAGTGSAAPGGSKSPGASVQPSSPSSAQP